MRYSLYLLSLVILFTTGCTQGDEPQPQPYPNDKKAAPPMSTVEPSAIVKDTVIVSATDLTAAYVANEIKADHDFKGNIVIVTGVVEDIKRGLNDAVFVILGGSEKFRAVQCYFSDETAAEKLTKGRKATFMGTCDGLMANVIVLDCKLINNVK